MASTGQNKLRTNAVFCVLSYRLRETNLDPAQKLPLVLRTSKCALTPITAPGNPGTGKKGVIVPMQIDRASAIPVTLFSARSSGDTDKLDRSPVKRHLSKEFYGNTKAHRSSKPGRAQQKQCIVPKSGGQGF